MKPKSDALLVPRLDCQIKDHLKAKGKDCREVFVQDSREPPGIAGPLSCLWSDLLDKGTKPSREQVLLLTQSSWEVLPTKSNLP